MSRLAHTRCGAGETLVLLHGIGLSRRVWDPIVPMLTERFDVLCVDLPGFGASEPLPPGTEPRPDALAAEVARLLDDLGIESPHLVGNSLGGWVALELAGLRAAASVTLLSPAGLWPRRTPVYCQVSLRASRWLARRAPGPLAWLVTYRAGRILVLGQSFGSRDHVLLPRQSRHLDQLPGWTRLQSLPGCGHVPTYDDPVSVADLITASTASTASTAHQGRR